MDDDSATAQPELQDVAHVARNCRVPVWHRPGIVYRAIVYPSPSLEGGVEGFHIM